MGRIGHDGRETRRIQIGSHAGTHCDAPRHFLSAGATVDKLPLDTLIGPASLVDFSGVGGPCIEAADLERELAGRPMDRLLLRFDWSDNWRKPTYYTDHPYLSRNAAHWLVDHGVRLVAMDTPTPDSPAGDGQDGEDSPVHKILLAGNVILVEYLTNLRSIQTATVELIVLPLKIQGGDGAPARCVAAECERENSR